MNNVIFGHNEIDTLIGEVEDGYLCRGNGNDKDDENWGDDTLRDRDQLSCIFVSNDGMSGNDGNDYVMDYGGADNSWRLGSDTLLSTTGQFRDFSPDILDCGSDRDIIIMNSGHGDTGSMTFVINMDRTSLALISCH